MKKIEDYEGQNKIQKEIKWLKELCKVQDYTNQFDYKFNEKMHKKILKQIDILMEIENKREGQIISLEQLAKWIVKYEDIHYPIEIGETNGTKI